MKRRACHWGWYWHIKRHHIPKSCCESYSHIDSFKLFKNKEGIAACMDKILLTMPSYKLTAKLHEHCIAFQFEYKGNWYGYEIPIEKNACHYGGMRYYFHCPKCTKRMRILYCFQGFFACRKCLKLGYLKQRLRPTLRYQFMSMKIKDLIKNKGGDLDLYRKPPHMHNTSYQKFRSKQFYYEAKSDQAINKEVRLWFGAKAEPYLDKFFDYVDESKEWRK